MDEVNSGVTLPRWLVGALVATILALVVAWAAQSITHERRLSVIESSRFTNTDGERLRREIMSSIPPGEVLRRLQSHEDRLDRVEGNR